jgi:hypothetical protein
MQDWHKQQPSQLISALVVVSIKLQMDSCLVVWPVQQQLLKLSERPEPLQLQQPNYRVRQAASWVVAVRRQRSQA